MVRASRLRSWRNRILLGKQEKVVRWHQAGLRLFWKRESKATKAREPRVAADTIDLIRRIALENRAGAPNESAENS